MECCRYGCPSGSSTISSEELWSSVRLTIGFLVTSLTKALLPRLLSFAQWPALGRVLVVLNFFHLGMVDATVFLGTFNAADSFWYPFPDLCLGSILSRSSMDNSFYLMAWFFLTCTVNCGSSTERCTRSSVAWQFLAWNGLHFSEQE